MVWDGGSVFTTCAGTEYVFLVDDGVWECLVGGGVGGGEEKDCGSCDGW